MRPAAKVGLSALCFGAAYFLNQQEPLETINHISSVGDVQNGYHALCTIVQEGTNMSINGLNKGIEGINFLVQQGLASTGAVIGGVKLGYDALIETYENAIINQHNKLYK